LRGSQGFCGRRRQLRTAEQGSVISPLGRTLCNGPLICTLSHVSCAPEMSKSSNRVRHSTCPHVSRPHFLEITDRRLARGASAIRMTENFDTPYPGRRAPLVSSSQAAARRDPALSAGRSGALVSVSERGQTMPMAVVECFCSLLPDVTARILLYLNARSIRYQTTKTNTVYSPSQNPFTVFLLLSIDLWGVAAACGPDSTSPDKATRKNLCGPHLQLPKPSPSAMLTSALALCRYPKAHGNGLHSQPGPSQ
jgi:hypothetical protein